MNNLLIYFVLLLGVTIGHGYHIASRFVKVPSSSGEISARVHEMRYITACSDSFAAKQAGLTFLCKLLPDKENHVVKGKGGHGDKENVNIDGKVDLDESHIVKGIRVYEDVNIDGKGDWDDKNNGKGDWDEKNDGQGDWDYKNDGKGDWDDKNDGKGDWDDKNNGKGDWDDKNNGKGNWDDKNDGKGDWDEKNVVNVNGWNRAADDTDGLDANNAKRDWDEKNDNDRNWDEKNDDDRNWDEKNDDDRNWDEKNYGNGDGDGKHQVIAQATDGNWERGAKGEWDKNAHDVLKERGWGKEGSAMEDWEQTFDVQWALDSNDKRNGIKSNIKLDSHKELGDKETEHLNTYIKSNRGMFLDEAHEHVSNQDANNEGYVVTVNTNNKNDKNDNDRKTWSSDHEDLHCAGDTWNFKLLRDIERTMRVRDCVDKNVTVLHQRVVKLMLQHILPEHRRYHKYIKVRCQLWEKYTQCLNTGNGEYTNTDNDMTDADAKAVTKVDATPPHAASEAVSSAGTTTQRATTTSPSSTTTTTQKEATIADMPVDMGFLPLDGLLLFY